MRLSTKRVERSAEADGQAAAQVLAVQSRAILSGALRVLRPAELPDMLYIEVDGTGLPMLSGRAGRGEDGRAAPARLACLFTQTRLDKDGNPVRDPDTRGPAPRR